LLSAAFSTLRANAANLNISQNFCQPSENLEKKSAEGSNWSLSYYCDGHIFSFSTPSVWKSLPAYFRQSSL